MVSKEIQPFWEMYQINSDGVLPTQFFEVSDAVFGEYLAVREFVSEQRVSFSQDSDLHAKQRK